MSGAVRFRLREVLEAAQISQRALAKLVGLNVARVNRICTNATAQISLETLDKVLTALERCGVILSLDDIIEREKPKRGRGN